MRELRPHLDRAFAGESVTFERRLECIDGVRDVRTSYVPLKGAEGEIALVNDITEQKRAEDARRESESQFRRIVELAREGIWIIDNDARTAFSNRRMAELLATGLFHRRDAGPLLPRFSFILKIGSAGAGLQQRIEGDSSPHEYRAVRKDGSIVWLDFTATPIRDNSDAITGLLAMCTDITERKLAQEQLQQTQKLESLGVLAGGIAHDFYNLLVGILGNLLASC